MPRIRMRDHSGYVEEVSSTNPVTLALWLYEHAQRNVNVNAAVGPLQLEVWPLYDHAGNADWKPGHEIVDMNQVQMHELMERLHDVLWPKKVAHERTEDEYATLREMKRIQGEAVER